MAWLRPSTHQEPGAEGGGVWRPSGRPAGSFRDPSPPTPPIARRRRPMILPVPVTAPMHLLPPMSGSRCWSRGAMAAEQSSRRAVTGGPRRAALSVAIAAEKSRRTGHQAVPA